MGAGVSEETEGVGSGPEGNGAGIDLTAAALALAGASREEANAFLKDQRALIAKQCALADDQRQHLHEQLKQIHLDVWEKQLGVFLRVATAVVGVAFAAFVTFMVWDAAHSNDLVIDSFAVPPDLVARGLSGQVVAAKLSDRVATLQAQTTSPRPARSYANGLSEGLKLEIPETGVSLSELDRFLREKLGHDLHIGGEMMQTEKGVSLTARAGSTGSVTVTGAEFEIDSLVEKLAEKIYCITQPYRCSIWLLSHGRNDEGVAVLKTLATNGPDSERAWAYNGWGVNTTFFQGETEGLKLLRRAQTLDPDNFVVSANIAASEYRSGLMQDSQRDYGGTLALLLVHGKGYALPDRLESSEALYRAIELRNRGDLLEAAEQARHALKGGGSIGGALPVPSLLAEILAALHEPRAAGVVLAENPLTGPNIIPNPASLIGALRVLLVIPLEAQDWPAVLAVQDVASVVPAQVLAKYPKFANYGSLLLEPLRAEALAHMGQYAAAEGRLKQTPADCYPCLRARAQVAALQNQDAQADFWFTRAAVIGPSLPFAYAEWGAALLDRGKPDEAIEKFRLANQKGPHFADPLEGWGEALMAKNQSHLALAKFSEAEKYAPNWGRLHLKWGQALVYAGKKDDAKAQFIRAAMLDLTPSEKSELARHP
jgi:tetratricopeptide (TPR) repeat protein